MAGDEELPDGDDEILDGAEGAGTEGQDPGDGDEDSEISPELADAPSGEDDGSSAPRGDEEDRPVTRGGNRVQRVVEERNALRTELAEMRRERQEARARAEQEQQQWTEQQWQERWNVMTPEEKINEIASQGRQQIQGLQNQMGLQVRMMKDEVSYDAKASVNPVYAKFKNEVETRFNEFQARGSFVPRQLILTQLLGERALATATGSTRQAKRQGQKKIEAQTTRPSTSKGDAASSRGKAGDSPEKRLAGVEI